MMRDAPHSPTNKQNATSFLTKPNLDSKNTSVEAFDILLRQIENYVVGNNLAIGHP